MSGEGVSREVALKFLNRRQRFWLNGHRCEVVRQARRTTFVKIVAGELAGSVVQLSRNLPNGKPRMVQETRPR